MAGDDNAAPLHECPGRDDLDAFARGQLPLASLEAIAEHLSECARCESSLEALHAEETILVHLRRQPAREFPLDDPACGELEDRARAIPLEHPVTPTVTDGASAESDADAVEGPQLPLAFGAYVLLARLGKGGMGIVYLARQEALKRLVALKLVRAGIYASPGERTRFQREGEAVARVQHGHVVQIHEFGEHEGQLFFSMELLEGGTLASKLNSKPLPEREAAELARTLARAVHAAHLHGIVHRDLKPGNVLFAADGTVKITDFGLAKMLDADGSDTRSDAILGTPAYMAPEQARGEIRTVGPATDVYALGTILYETLTGQPPFRGETHYQTLELVRAGEPKVPSRLRRRLSRDLEAICLTCLEKGPAQRYASAEALADDLDRWLRGEPVLARPRFWLVRTWRAARRYRRLTSRLLIAAVLLALLALAWKGLSPSVPPGERETPEQRRALEEKLAQMRNGEKVTLLGESGPPGWSSWIPRRSDARTLLDLNRVFRVHAAKPRQYALLELLPEAPPRFRLRAHVQHSEGRFGQVGIYFCRGTRQTEEGVTHCFFKHTFNDRFGVFDPQLPGGAARSEVFLSLSILREKGGAVINSPRNAGCALGHLFAVTGERESMPWRRLEAEVTPERIKVFWEGEQITNPMWRNNENGCDPKKPMEWASLLLGATTVRHQGGPPQPLVTVAELGLGGGIGLYVEGGTAAFQSVVIESLTLP